MSNELLHTHQNTSRVISRMDNCNSLLYGQYAKNTQKLQKIQNRAARLARKKKHTTPLLKELYWLPVCEQINYKLLTLAYKSKHATTPPYLQNLYIKPHNYSDGNIFLCSQADDNLHVSNRTHTTYRDNAFCNSVPFLWHRIAKGISVPKKWHRIAKGIVPVCSVPFLWNKLPKMLCTFHSLATFKSNLKTHLFPK